MAITTQKHLTSVSIRSASQVSGRAKTINIPAPIDTPATKIVQTVACVKIKQLNARMVIYSPAQMALGPPQAHFVRKAAIQTVINASSRGLLRRIAAHIMRLPASPKPQQMPQV